MVSSVFEINKLKSELLPVLIQLFQSEPICFSFYVYHNIYLFGMNHIKLLNWIKFVLVCNSIHTYFGWDENAFIEGKPMASMLSCFSPFLDTDIQDLIWPKTKNLKAWFAQAYYLPLYKHKGYFSSINFYQNIIDH